MALQADSAGFLIGGQPIKPTRTELTLLQRMHDDVRAIRRILERKGDKPGTDKRAANDPGEEEKDARGATVRPATPRLTTTSALTKSVAPGDMGRAVMPVGKVKPLDVKVTVATPQRATSERPVIDRAMPMRDANGRFVSSAKPAKPELSKPAKTIKSATADAATGERDSKGRFTGGGKDQEDEGSKIGKLLGDIRDKISGPDLSGGEEVDPNIKAAQEIAGVAGGALNGIKAVGGVLGTVATPMLSGAKGLFKPKAHDAPTPWFKRFFNELRGLRREESVFNRAQLRTLKEIEAKPGEGKGGGIMGMLMMLIGPLMAAIGAAITAGFGLLMKLPGMGLLAKLATGLMPAALTPKKPITQPTTVPPGTPGKTAPKGTVDPKTGLPSPLEAGTKPVEATKKPTLWERAKSKVAGWTGTPEVATPSTTASTTPGTTAGGAAGAAAEVAKKPGLLARAGSGAMGMLKRVPLLGTALAALSIGTGVYASESDDTTTRAEKDKNTGKAVGGGGGAIAGMMGGGAAGAKAGALVGLIGGPIGSAIGAAIGGVVGGVAGGFFGEKAGNIVGEKVGGWVTDIRNADIGGMITRTWASTTDTMGKGWDSALKTFGGIWDKAKGVFDDLSLGVTNLLAKFGIDLPDIKKKAADALAAAEQKAKDVAGAVGGAVGAAKDKVVQGATAAVDYGKEKAGQAGEALKNSAMGRGAAAIAGLLGIDGTKRIFQRSDGTTEERNGGTVAWRNNNEGNLKFGYSGSADPTDKSKRTKAQALASAQKNYDGVVDLDQFGNAIFATPEAGRDAKKKLLLSKHSDKTVEEMLPKYAVTDYSGKADHAAYASSLYKTAGERGLDIKGKKIGDLSKPEFDALMDGMKKVEGFKLGSVAVSGVGAPVGNAPPAIPASPATTTVVTAGARNIPRMPSLAVEPPKVPDFQPVTAGLSSAMGGGQEQRPSVIVVGNKTPVGRDLSNRPLAHIVTGGLSGS